MTRLIPVDDDHDTAGFFAAAKEHRLVVRVCKTCDTTLHMPRDYCYVCRSFNGEWREASPTGSLFTWTIVEHGVHADYVAPYAVVLVQLDAPPGVRLVGNIPGRPELQMGMAMEVWWDEVGEGVTIPNWRPVG
jgi:uncharacterized OB-fold protein